MSRLTSRAVIAALLLFVILPSVSFACPVCYGPSDSPMAKGMNNAIGFLLVIVAFVQIGFAALFITFWRRARESRRRLHLVEPTQ
jgi:uncharacterized membrane protein